MQDEKMCLRGIYHPPLLYVALSQPFFQHLIPSVLTQDVQLECQNIVKQLEQPSYMYVISANICVIVMRIEECIDPP